MFQMMRNFLNRFRTFDLNLKHPRLETGWKTNSKYIGDSVLFIRWLVDVYIVSRSDWWHPLQDDEAVFRQSDYKEKPNCSISVSQYRGFWSTCRLDARRGT